MCRFSCLLLCAGLVSILAGCGGESSAPFCYPVTGSDDGDSADGDATPSAPMLTPAAYPPNTEVATKPGGPLRFLNGDFKASTEVVSGLEKSERTPSSVDSRESEGFGEESTDSNRASSQQRQSGTLTAGSLDDHANFDEYRSYLAQSMQRNPGQFPSLSLGRRILIRVQNAQGDGIGDARVKIQPISEQTADEGPVVLDVTTRSDGRTLFLTEFDAAGAGPNFLLTVEPPNGAATVARRVHIDQTPWTVELPEAERRLPNQLDLALVIDTTGSMGDELEYLKVEIDSIAAAVHGRFPNVDVRYALIVYRDEGDQYVTRSYDFTGSLETFRQLLASQSATGGGDYPEAMHQALEQAGRLSWRTKETARVLFLVGDAPPHSRYAPRALEAVKKLRLEGVTIFPVAASGVREQAEFVMRSAAFLTLGQYLFLTDHSGIGNPHAKPTAPRYTVERLDRLMIRMIASELAGTPLLPEEIIATEGNRPNGTPRTDQLARRQHSPERSVPPDVRATTSASVATSTTVRWIGAVVALVLLILADVRWRM